MKPKQRTESFTVLQHSDSLALLSNVNFPPCRDLLCGLLMVYVIQKSPALDLGLLEGEANVTADPWEAVVADILRRARTEPDKVDEHHLKLVQVRRGAT